MEDYTSPCGKHYCLYHYRTWYYQLHEVMGTKTKTENKNYFVR